MVDCLPASQGSTGTGDDGESGLTARLWRKLCPGTSGTRLRDTLRAALVLLADHELAASTLAARVAASVRADPYAVVAIGLGAAGGALHGGASLGVEAMLAAAGSPADVPRVVSSVAAPGRAHSRVWSPRLPGR